MFTKEGELVATCVQEVWQTNMKINGSKTDLC